MTDIDNVHLPALGAASDFKLSILTIRMRQKNEKNRCSCCCHSFPPPRIGQFQEANYFSITWIFLLLNPQVEIRSTGQYLNKSKTKLIVLSMLNLIILKQFCLFFNANDLRSFAMLLKR